ncbi:MAG TPA: hypothetical protein PKE47_05745 [Verrucomicrobiota bacterium]|nr:hypothetical protein [Verrucomicrobiota bacterium]
MNPKDILELVEARPFKPFRLLTSDGGRLEVRHPEFIWVLRSRVDVAVLAQEDHGIVDHVEHCSMLQITRLEELEPATL